MDNTSFITTSDGHGQAVLVQADVIMLIMTYVNWKFMVFILRMSNLFFCNFAIGFIFLFQDCKKFSKW